MSQKKFQFKTLDAFLSPKFNLHAISMSAKRLQRLSLADFDREAAATSAVGAQHLEPAIAQSFPTNLSQDATAS